jgi:hypothetical protein
MDRALARRPAQSRSHLLQPRTRGRIDPRRDATNFSQAEIFERTYAMGAYSDIGR